MMEILGSIAELVWVVVVGYTVYDYWKLRNSDWSDL